MLNKFTEAGTKVIFTDESIKRGSSYEEQHINELVAKGILTLGAPYVIKHITSGVKVIAELHQVKSYTFNIELMDEYKGSKPLVPLKAPLMLDLKQPVSTKEKLSPENLAKVWAKFEENMEIKTGECMDILGVTANEYQSRIEEIYGYIQTMAKTGNYKLTKKHGRFILEHDKPKEYVKDEKDLRIDLLEANAEENRRLLKEYEEKNHQLQVAYDLAKEQTIKNDSLSHGIISSLRKDIKEWKMTAESLETINTNKFCEIEDLNRTIEILENENKNLTERLLESNSIDCEEKMDLELSGGMISDLAKRSSFTLNANGITIKGPHSNYARIADAVKDAYINTTDETEKKLIAAILESTGLKVSFEWRFIDEEAD